MVEDCLVFVQCRTYNQSTYIKDALDGFCIQQTKFPYVCGIIDDASTDGEQDILRHYLNENFDIDNSNLSRYDETEDYVRVFAHHKTNKNCYFVVVYLKYNHYRKNKEVDSYMETWERKTKYVAICEGDDYWVDSKKLQKQVDFMERHLNHSLCFCAYQALLSSGEKKMQKRYMHDIEVCPINDIILGGGEYMATNSMLFRNSLYVPYSTWAIDCPIGDLPLMLTLANKGLVGYLSDVMCVYRVMAQGSWSSRMASNMQSRLNHHRRIIKMWHQFDVWSDKKFHKIIKKKLRRNNRGFFRNELLLLLKKIK